MASYRPNVAAILRHPTSRDVLIAERSDFPGFWQFPQGGVDKGEDLIAALRREVREETGIPPESYSLVACRTNYRYKFPGKLKKKWKWQGQEQTWFLCDFHGEKEEVTLEEADHEFRDVRWIEPADFEPGWVPSFKRDVYARVFRDFFAIRWKDEPER